MKKTSVGLATKGTAAHVVTHLAHIGHELLQPHTSKLLGAFLVGLSGDRNPAVRKCYASGLFTNSFFCFFQDKEGLFESFSLTSDSTSLPQIQRTQSGVDSIRLVLGSFHLLKIELGKKE